MFKRIYIEITNVCNLRCRFCPGTKRAPGFMTPERFSLFCDRLRGHTRYLYFHLMGEPLLHPQLEELLRRAEDAGFRVVLTTNGTLLQEKGQMLLDAPALHRVNLSLQSYEANEQTQSLETYTHSCAQFAAACAETGRLCSLRLWNGGGEEENNARIIALLKERFPEPWQKGKLNETLRPGVFLERAERFSWPDLAEDDRGESCFCHGLRDQLGVLWDGTVVPCCLDHEGDIALGNLQTQSLEEILATPRVRQMYAGFTARRATEDLCRRCGYARRF